MAKEIIAYKDGEKKWHITIDGTRHPSDFVSVLDIRTWVGTMQSNGLYTERPLIVPNEETGSMREVEPIYD